MPASAPPQLQARAAAKSQGESRFFPERTRASLAHRRLARENAAL
jgi:hypothetical protein